MNVNVAGSDTTDANWVSPCFVATTVNVPAVVAERTVPVIVPTPVELVIT